MHITEKKKQWVTVWHKRKTGKPIQQCQFVLDKLSAEQIRATIAFAVELAKDFASKDLPKSDMNTRKKLLQGVHKQTGDTHFQKTCQSQWQRSAAAKALEKQNVPRRRT